MELNFGIVRRHGQCQCAVHCDVWRLVNTFGRPTLIVRLLPKKAGHAYEAQTRCQKEPPEPMDVNHETLRILTNSRRINIWGWWNQPSIQPHKPAKAEICTSPVPLCCIESIACTPDRVLTSSCHAWDAALRALLSQVPGTRPDFQLDHTRGIFASSSKSVLGIVGFQQKCKSIL